MANYVPSDTESLQMLELTASALESRNRELRLAASALELSASALESRNRELSLAVSRLTSRPKKKKAAADRQQTSVVASGPVALASWGPDTARHWETELAQLVAAAGVSPGAKPSGYLRALLQGQDLVGREVPVVPPERGSLRRRLDYFRKLKPSALTEASGPPRQELARP
jgi:hypothetical protein